jgi:hypothetical protein
VGAQLSEGLPDPTETEISGKYVVMKMTSRNIEFMTP